MKTRIVLFGLGAVVASCQGPESYRGAASGPSTGAAGNLGASGVGILPVTVPGTAGVSGAGGATPVSAGVAGASGGAGPSGLAGMAGAQAGAVGTSGAAGTSSGAAGASSGAAGTSSGVAGTSSDAGASAAGSSGASGSVPQDAAVEAPPAQPYSSARWKPTASITAAGTANLPPNAVDGNVATRWTTGRNQMGNETFVVDMGVIQSVGRVVLDDTTNPQDFPAAYTLELSTNDTTFTSVKTGTGATITDIDFVPAMARYVRVRQTGTTPAPAGSWWSIDELRIYP